MNRDMDIVRKIILTVADDKDGVVNGVTDVPQEIFAAHAQWLEEAGLITAAIGPTDTKRSATRAVIFRLTWVGCDFADAIRSDTLWAKAKANVLKPSASWTFGLLKDWLAAEVREGFPSLRS